MIAINWSHVVGGGFGSSLLLVISFCCEDLHILRLLCTILQRRSSCLGLKLRSQILRSISLHFRLVCLQPSPMRSWRNSIDVDASETTYIVVRRSLLFCCEIVLLFFQRTASSLAGCRAEKHSLGWLGFGGRLLKIISLIKRWSEFYLRHHFDFWGSLFYWCRPQISLYWA